MKKLFFIIAVFFSTISSGFADGVKFSASAPGQVIKGQTFQITFTLINANGQDLRVPEFPGCNVLFGPAVSQGSQFTSINGKTTTQTEESYTYTLKAIKEGTYKIGSASSRAYRLQPPAHSYCPRNPRCWHATSFRRRKAMWSSVSTAATPSYPLPPTP